MSAALGFDPPFDSVAGFFLRNRISDPVLLLRNIELAYTA